MPEPGPYASSMRRTHRRVGASVSALFVIATIAAFAVGAGCDDATTSALTGEGGASGANTADAAGGGDAKCVPDPDPQHRTLDPSVVDRSCSGDSDCTTFRSVSPDLAGPGSCQVGCCDDHGARNTDALMSALAQLHKSCCEMTTCAKECPAVVARCVQSQCVAVAPDAGAPSDASADGPDGD